MKMQSLLCRLVASIVLLSMMTNTSPQQKEKKRRKSVVFELPQGAARTGESGLVRPEEGEEAPPPPPAEEGEVPPPPPTEEEPAPEYPHEEVFAAPAPMPSTAEQRDALISAASRGDIALVDELLRRNPGILEQRDAQGYNALLAAIGTGKRKMVRHLLDTHHANIEARNAEGRTALIIASGEGNNKLVESLIKRGANINAADNNGTTALMIAAEEDYPEIVVTLLAAGANRSVQDDQGETALDRAEDESRALLEKAEAEAKASQIRPALPSTPPPTLPRPATPPASLTRPAMPATPPPVEPARPALPATPPPSLEQRPALPTSLPPALPPLSAAPRPSAMPATPPIAQAAAKKSAGHRKSDLEKLRSKFEFLINRDIEYADDMSRAHAAAFLATLNSLINAEGHSAQEFSQSDFDELDAKDVNFKNTPAGKAARWYWFQLIKGFTAAMGIPIPAWALPWALQEPAFDAEVINRTADKTLVGLVDLVSKAGEFKAEEFASDPYASAQSRQAMEMFNNEFTALVITSLNKPLEGTFFKSLNNALRMLAKQKNIFNQTADGQKAQQMWTAFKKQLINLFPGKLLE